MNIRDIMSSGVEVVSPDTSLREAAKKMRTGDFGVLPVCDNGRLLGMVTDRDICIRAIAEGDDPDHTSVQEVMSDNVMYCYEDQDVEEVADLMSDRKIRRIPVMDRNENLTGIVSLGDLAVHSDSKRPVTEALEEISQSAHH